MGDGRFLLAKDRDISLGANTVLRHFASDHCVCGTQAGLMAGNLNTEKGRGVESKEASLPFPVPLSLVRGNGDGLVLLCCLHTLATLPLCDLISATAVPDCPTSLRLNRTVCCLGVVWRGSLVVKSTQLVVVSGKGVSVQHQADRFFICFACPRHCRPLPLSTSLSLSLSFLVFMLTCVR